MIITQNDFLEIKSQDNNVLLFTTLKPSITEEEWLDCQRMVDLWYKHAKENDKQFGVLVNMSSITYFKKKFYVSWKEKYLLNKENTEKYVFGAAIKIENFIVRRFINAFFTIYKLSKPILIVKSLDEGYEFLKKHKI